MRRVGKFHLVVAAVAMLGLGAAIAAGLGATALAISFIGLGLAAMAALLLVMERRAKETARRIRRSADHANRNSTNRILGDVRRVEMLVEVMQRRVVTAVESARVEAADRHHVSAKK